MSRRRANLPLSSSAQAPSPSHCEGWLQICFNRMRKARTMPLRLIPSTSSSWLAEILHRLLVERRLLAAQGAERFHLGLVGQVGNDALVGLQAPQDIGTHQIAERTVRVLRPVGEAFDEGRKLLRRSQQSGIDEVEDRPQIAEPVLDGRAGQCDARFGLQLLDRLGLLGGRILDGLRLVKHHQSPGVVCEPRNASQKAVARDDQIDIRQIVAVRLSPVSRPASPMDGRQPR